MNRSISDVFLCKCRIYLNPTRGLHLAQMDTGNFAFAHVIASSLHKMCSLCFCIGRVDRPECSRWRENKGLFIRFPRLHSNQGRLLQPARCLVNRSKTDRNMEVLSLKLVR
jgi:hypothetical protein